MNHSHSHARPSSISPALSRRTFLAGTAAIGAFAIVQPSQVAGAAANSKVTLGLIGCGGRGAWIANLFAETGLYEFVACSDYFSDRVEMVGGKHNIPATRRYTGLSGYKRLLENAVDAVVIETPPYFHPQQAADAVTAGKHVFIAKPIAVDAPGCLSIGESGKLASQKRLVFLVDFQTRADPYYREALRRVRQGEIGRLVMGEAHYPWAGGARTAPPASPEERLRQWYNVREISGDFIVEQAIHALDVATWILDANPVRAIGMGGQKLRPKGSIWDHFAINYEFPDNVPLSFTCIQTIPEMKDEITARVYGSDGYISTDYFGSVFIRGKEFYTGAKTGNVYTTGAQTNIREFHQFITQGRYDNPTVAPSVRSNLTAVLGREAGYKGGEVTLADLIREGRRLEPDLRGVRS